MLKSSARSSTDLVERLRRAGAEGSDGRGGMPICLQAADEITRLRGENGRMVEALRGLVTPALIGLINAGDDRMPDDAAVDVTGNGFRCQLTVGDIRKASLLSQVDHE